ncbi:MAG: 2-oxoadipate dioxygenase/decarboxylase family protein [Planctomycetota bacterium]
MQPLFADRTELQHQLFARLSAMFASEVPLYDRSLAVNELVNGLVCELMTERFVGLRVTAAEVTRASAERHGAIRIGRPDEYRWIARFFGVFAMEPHNFYSMTDIGAKSQPVIATAFRSAARPEHRVFTSLLVTDRFDPATRGRIENALAGRTVFSARAQSLIERCEQEGGLSSADGEALIAEACTRIFKWTGRARDHQLYTDLCTAGFKIAADIACFDSHHLNHLTPNTLCMDLYTAAMKFCFGQVDAKHFLSRAREVLGRLAATADRPWLRLHLPHLSKAMVDTPPIVSVDGQIIDRLIQKLQQRLNAPEFHLASLKNAGFKDFTEGPPGGTPVLLRQDAYRAVAEPVSFMEPDGTTVQGEHTARFGEIEERFYATTPEGRALYDACLEEAERLRGTEKPNTNDLAAHERALAAPFARIPKTLEELVEQGLVYAEWEPTALGLATRGTIDTHDFVELLRRGLVRCEGIRYEDFLPISAAGIFASNLNQYGTHAEGAAPRTFIKSDLEEIIGRPIIESATVYAINELESRQRTLVALGLAAVGRSVQ